MKTMLKTTASRVLNLILPPLCLSCRGPIADTGAVCGTCWQELRFIGDPQCSCCGFPFEIDYGGDTLCAKCHEQKPDYDMARAALVYNDMSRNLILALKHGDQWHGVPAFGQWLSRAATDFAAVDIIVPVPLHWTRLFRRKYNQAALLAKALAKNNSARMVLDGLIRQRSTQSQGTFRRKGRFRNVENVFAVHPARLAAVQGKSVLLVDDVLTTGATIQACTKTLLKAGAASVQVVTLARVV